MSDLYAPPATAEERAPASAWLAVLLSIIALGAGHVYIGRWRRGLRWFGGLAASALLFGALAPPVFRAIGIIGIALLGLAPFVVVVATCADAARLARGRTSRVAVTLIVAALVGFTIGRSVLAITVRAFFIEAFNIPSGGMLPTLAVGDHIFVDKLAARLHTPRRGELIVFPFPAHPDQDFIQRVVGLPGDVVEVDRGRVTINGWQVPRCPLDEWRYPDEVQHHGEVWVEFLGESSYLVFEDDLGPGTVRKLWRVAPGEVFTMGDNRENSHDSRMWRGGAGGGVPIDSVRAAALTIWMSARDDASPMDWTREGLDLTGRSPGPPPRAEQMVPALEQCLRQRPKGTLGP